MSEELKELNTEAVVEAIPSMDEFKDEINRSFKKMNDGDIITGTIIGVSDTEVSVDLGYYTEGIIKIEELSNDPRFSIKADMIVGKSVTAMVIGENREGNIILSKKRAEDELAWAELKEGMNGETIYKVKTSTAVNGGVITYLFGIRAFIPASQLALSYVEDLAQWENKELEVMIIDIEEDTKKLVLSSKNVLRLKQNTDKNNKISKLQVGLVTTGLIEKLTPYGAFANIGEELTGLIHISQICGKHIKSPSEVLKEGDEVKVKILDIKDGKISLSIKAVEEQEEVIEEIEEAPFEYSTGGEVNTGLASLLQNIKL